MAHLPCTQRPLSLALLLAVLTLASAPACKGGATLTGKPDRPGPAVSLSVSPPAGAPKPVTGAVAPGKRSAATLEELRGVWVTTVDSQVLYSKAGVTQVMAQLDALNFTTVYPVVWGGGRTLYPSNTVRAVSGEPMDPDPRLAGRDVVKEFLAEGARLDIKVVPWFEYGLKVPFDSAFARAKPTWLTADSQGQKFKLTSGVRMAWLNPLVPEVQAFYAALVTEFLQTYGVSRVQFDDNFSVPKDMLYDDFTRALYAKQGGGTPPTSSSDPRWNAWVKWRADRISDAVSAIFTAVKAGRPGTHISLSPNPAGWALANYLQDWKAWLTRGAVDSIVVQLYRNSMSAFQNDLEDPLLVAEKNRVAIGILSGLRGAENRVPITLVQAQVQAARAAGYRGVSFFFYESLFNYPASGEEVQARVPALQALFGTMSKEPSGF